VRELAARQRTAEYYHRNEARGSHEGEEDPGKAASGESAEVSDPPARLAPVHPVPTLPYSAAPGAPGC